MTRSVVRRLSAAATAAAMIGAGAFIGAPAIAASTSAATLATAPAAAQAAPSETQTAAPTTTPQKVTPTTAAPTAGADKKKDATGPQKPAPTKPSAPTAKKTEENRSTQKQPSTDKAPQNTGGNKEAAEDPNEPQAALESETATVEQFRPGGAGLRLTFTGVRDDLHPVIVAPGIKAESIEAAPKEGRYVFKLTAADAKDVVVGKKFETVEAHIKNNDNVSLVAVAYTITIVDDNDAADFAPNVSLAPKKISRKDFADPKKGVTITATNLKPGDTVTSSLNRKRVTATGDTATIVEHYSGNPADIELGEGTMNVTVTRGEQSKDFTQSYTVVDDDEAEKFDPIVSSAPDKITIADLLNKDKGILVTATQLKPGDVVSNSLTGNSSTAEGDSLKYRIWAEADPSAFSVGQKVDFTVTVKRGDETKDFKRSFTIVGDDDESAAQPVVTATPKKISVADFRNKDKGVRITVQKCEPGVDAKFSVTKKNGVNDFAHTVKTDKSGAAVLPHLHGKGNAKDAAYLGEYTVKVSCGDLPAATTSFTVVNSVGDGGKDDDSTGGGDSRDSGDRDGRGQLPRTGSDLGLLYGAAGLLALGAGALVLSRRSAKRN